MQAKQAQAKCHAEHPHLLDEFVLKKALHAQEVSGVRLKTPLGSGGMQSYRLCGLTIRPSPPELKGWRGENFSDVLEPSNQALASTSA